jgi:hypothetical protein
MTSGVTLSFGTVTVDLNSSTCRDVTVTHRFSNPVITLSTPYTAGTAIGQNEKIVNIGFTTDAFDLSFTLLDGPASFDFITPGSTNYEKLVYIAHMGMTNKTTLTVNGTAFSGAIENLNVPWQAGKKDLAQNGTLTFHLGDTIVVMS